MSSEIKALVASLTPEQLAASKHQNHNAQVYTYSAVFSALATLAVIMRVTSRHMKKVAVGLDDIFIIAALVVSVGQTIFICIGVRDYGLGRHIWTLTEEQLVNFQKLWFTIGSTQCTGLLLTKVSLLILYHRIFITPAFRFAVKLLGGILALWWIGTILADNLICIPASKNWNPSLKGHCGNKHLLAILPPIPWIVTDLAVLLMPVTMVWNLHLPKLQRFGLAAVFLLGGFSTFASCYRYSLLFYSMEDVTWTLIPASIWTIIELDITIITVCLIVSRPWLLKIWPSKLISTVRSKMPSVRRSSNEKHTPPAPGYHKRWPLMSTFRRLDDRPPLVTAVSLGAPFEIDVEKTANLETRREVVGKDKYYWQR